MLDIDSAYLAGLFDGEGSILVRVRTKNNINPCVTCHIEISLTDLAPLEWCKAATGRGSIYTLKRASNPNWSQAYRWVVSNQQINPILESMLPYLKIKKEQAELALKINAFRTEYRRGHTHDIKSQVIMAAKLRSLRTSKRAKPLDPESFTYITPVKPIRDTKGKFFVDKRAEG